MAYITIDVDIDEFYDDDLIEELKYLLENG